MPETTLPAQRILVVEDEADQRALVAAILGREGHQVQECGSVDEAVESLGARPADLVLSDWRLPGKDGMELLRHVRASHPGTAFIMVTAHGTIHHAVEAVRAGADDYLTKPFDLAELLARVQALIRRAQFKREDAALRVGILRLVIADRAVTVGDRSVELSPREFSLLEFLMRNAGRTMSRSRIAEAVWNYQFDPGTNVVDVYINYLRKKLGEMSDGTEIRTVRGVGYRLEGP